MDFPRFKASYLFPSGNTVTLHPFFMYFTNFSISEFESLIHPSEHLDPIDVGKHVPCMPIPLNFGTFSLTNQGPYAPFLSPNPSLKS